MAMCNDLGESGRNKGGVKKRSRSSMSKKSIEDVKNLIKHFEQSICNTMHSLNISKQNTISRSNKRLTTIRQPYRSIDRTQSNQLDITNDST